MRLIKISETSSQVEYESEQGYIKVTAYLSSNIVRYFSVRYPDGKTATYGYTNNYNLQLVFPLTTMTDRFGNTITYQYDYRDNNYTPAGISYSNASLEFQYQDYRDDAPFAYQSGIKVAQNRLLTGIVCKYGSHVLRTYTFSYITQGNCYLLEYINLSAGTLAVNPLKFYYGENNTAYGYTHSQTQLLEWYNFTSPSQVCFTRGKFDYGTNDDGILVWPGPKDYSYWQHYRSPNLFRHSQNRFDNYYSGTEKIFLYAGLNNAYATPMPNLTTESGFIGVFCANLDGKWEDEVIKINNNVSGNNDQITFKVYAPNLYTGLGYKYMRTFNFSTVLTDADGGKSIHPKFYFPGDFNGDGKVEILAVSCHQPFGWSGSPSKCYLFDLEANSKLYEGQPFAYNVSFWGTQQTDGNVAAQNSDRLYILDYDGDGKSDICLVNSSGMRIYTFNVSGTSYSLENVANYTGITKSGLNNRTLLFGEFNGDGKTDLLLSPAQGSGSTWTFHYSKGTGLFETKTTYGPANSSGYSFYTQDLNGDGLTDLIKTSESGYHTYLIQPNSSSIYSDSYTTFPVSNSLVIPVDINSNSYYSRIVSISGGIATKHSFQRDDFRERLLTGMVNSFGVIDRNFYRRMDEASAYPGFYTQGYGAVFPYINFSGPFYIPVNREKYHGGQLCEDIDFLYENAIVHKQGLGFRGFGKLTVYDRIRGHELSRTFDPYNFGLPLIEESSFSKTTNTYTVNIQSNRIVKTTLANRLMQDKLKETTATASYTYDSYGNPLTETLNYGGGITQTTSSSYVNNTGTPYVLGFLTNQTVTTFRSALSNSNRVQIAAYNSLLMPTTQYRYANGNRTLEETFNYDAQGNVTQKGLKSYSSDSILTTAYTYDAFGRQTGKTNPLGLTTTYNYDASTGLLSSEVNHKGQLTAYSYDAFGRLNQTTHPNGIPEVSNYAWGGIEGTNTLYCHYQHLYTTPWRKTFYDALGRETLSGVVNMHGIEPCTEKLYDSHGRLWKVSLPFNGRYNGASPSHWTVYHYDSYDRPTAIAEPSGRTTSYSYAGNSVTTTKEGISSTQTFDTQGNLISVTDPAGTITYNLRPDGQPASITAPCGVTTSFTYDGYGRRETIVDPSAGTQTWAYDVAGNTASETDAAGRTISYGYDSYNRVITKTCPEFTTHYRYGPEGQLLADSISPTRFTTWAYDEYGRLWREKETFAANKFIQRESVYSGENLLARGYDNENGYIIHEDYHYSFGQLAEITIWGDDTYSIWKLDSVNAAGQPLNVTTRNFSRSYSYNDYGIPTGRTAGSFMNFTYGFDAAKGNLSWRKDNTRNIQENFSYDDLNRLTGYAGKSAAYDLKGNITQKSDIGTTFLYAVPGKPYAISGVNTGAHTAIPLRNQTLTYTSFKRPATITEGEYTAAFTYDGSGQRKKMELKKNGVKELDRYYLLNSYEMDDPALGGIKEKIYLGGDAYTAPAVAVREGGSWNIYYLCRDYLGSITHIATGSGSLVQELSYDAWGRLRNPANQQAYAPDSEPELFFGRGYTGHEHLPQFGLINMNARLYDPALGRFLSPDPYVQAPDFSQNFNRYSYCFNNPLKYTDPTGEWALIDDLIVAIVGGVVNVVVNAVQGNVHSWGQGFALFGVGAVGSWTGLYVGPLAAGGVIGAGNNFVNQGFGDSGKWDWNNIKVEDVLMNGLMGAGMSYIGGQVSGLISPHVSKFTSFIGGQAVRQMTEQSVIGSATGFVVGTGAALINGENIGDALKIGGKGAGLGFVTGAISGLASGMRSAHKAGENPWTGKSLNVNNTQFGNNPNQEYHTFRHTNELGLNQLDVQNAIEIDIQLRSNNIEFGKPFNQVVTVNGQRIQYTAYKLPDGTINIGRIHGVK